MASASDRFSSRATRGRHQDLAFYGDDFLVSAPGRVAMGVLLHQLPRLGVREKTVETSATTRYLGVEVPRAGESTGVRASEHVADGTNH